ncbi:SRPBCC domain-containing protein [Sediminibacillus massiliensis]|uniref:SRPBCC domain-containing protein n=1 Tax=Sediminibacillus massiliensis TaxID=1926277 RepID=UPI0009883E50|nr:SRPBCC domain-containing protein [Sediminibacillus massiliensis]
MNDYGKLHQFNGRYYLSFDRYLPVSCNEAFRVITDPQAFTQWYPFATGEMELKEGGAIAFDDGEGSIYEAVITQLDEPRIFAFREVDDLIEITMQEEQEGCKLNFKHTFDNDEWASNMAAGWHRCLDVLVQIVNGQPVEWGNNSVQLRERYKKEFNM